MSDLIVREDAIMALRLEYPMMPFFKENQKEWAIKTEGYRKAEEVIMKLPSVRPKEGKWFHYEGMLYCSECHTEIYNGIMEYLGDDVPKFCPNCGADMRGERSGTDKDKFEQ